MSNASSPIVLLVHKSPANGVASRGGSLEGVPNLVDAIEKGIDHGLERIVWIVFVFGRTGRLRLLCPWGDGERSLLLLLFSGDPSCILDFNH